MGLSVMKNIKREALKIGIPNKTKCAIISNASRNNQKVILTNLQDMITNSNNIISPAILIFGDVLNYKLILDSYNN